MKGVKMKNKPILTMVKTVVFVMAGLTTVVSCTHHQVSPPIISSDVENQTDADSLSHLTFKGIPIDGTLREYVTKMEQNGFTYKRSEDGVAMLVGDFAGYRNCIVWVGTLKQQDLVSKITVIFPNHNTWSSLSFNYFSLKQMLTEKYGKPLKCVETFQSRYPPDDDGEKMYEVKFDRCKYYTVYKTAQGSIELSIEHEGVTRCFVALSYYDKINSNLRRAKVKDDL